MRPHEAEKEFLASTGIEPTTFGFESVALSTELRGQTDQVFRNNGGDCDNGNVQGFFLCLVWSLFFHGLMVS